MLEDLRPFIYLRFILKTSQSKARGLEIPSPVPKVQAQLLSPKYTSLVRMIQAGVILLACN